MKIIWIQICFLVSSLMYCANVFPIDSSENNPTFNAKSITYFQLAEALYQSGDLSSSVRTLNFIIISTDSNQKDDGYYTKNLHKLISIYSSHEYEKSVVAVTESPIQNHLAPTSKIENGYLIIENVPQEMLEGQNSDWIQKVLNCFGMEVAPSDIQYKGNTIAVKLPSCCCCCKNQSFEATSNSD